MEDYNEKINALDIGAFIFSGGSALGSRFNDKERDLLVILDTAYDEAEKAVSKIITDNEIKDKEVLSMLMAELTGYGTIAEITGFCHGLKAGVRLFLELAVK